MVFYYFWPVVEFVLDYFGCDLFVDRQIRVLLFDPRVDLILWNRKLVVLKIENVTRVDLKLEMIYMKLEDV